MPKQCPTDGTSTLKGTIIPNLQPGFGVLLRSQQPGHDPTHGQPMTSRPFSRRGRYVQGAEFRGFACGRASGLSATPLALTPFPSDAYKAGTADPRFMFSHFFVRQTVGLGGGGGNRRIQPDGQFTLPGTDVRAAHHYRWPAEYGGTFRLQHLQPRSAHTIHELGEVPCPPHPDTVGFHGEWFRVESARLGSALVDGFNCPAFRMPRDSTSDDRIFVSGPSGTGENLRWGVF